MDEIITKYLQGEASEEEKKQLLDWLRESEANQKAFTEMRDVWLASGKASLFNEDYTQNAFQKFTRQVEAYESTRRPYPFRSLWKVAAAVALLIVCTVGGYYAGKTREANLLADQPVTIVNKVLTQEGGKTKVTLPDGTVAWLNSNSRLLYPEQFTEDERRVKLEGEGYFDVVRDEQRPFYVETNGMEVNVLGTRFDVKNYDGSHTTETTLLSGKVEVFFPKTNKYIILEPNQKIQSDKQTGDYQLSNVEADNYIVWINDKLAFNNDKLSDIFTQMEHWYNIDIVYGKDVPASQRLSFTIRRETKEEIFNLLSLIAPITYKIEGNKVYIQSK